MGKQATQEETKIVKSMIQDEVAGWYLLKLPNEFYAAFWRSGIDCCHASGVAHGDYELSCAKTGTLGEVAVYIKDILQ